MVLSVLFLVINIVISSACMLGPAEIACEECTRVVIRRGGLRWGPTQCFVSVNVIGESQVRDVLRYLTVKGDQTLFVSVFRHLTFSMQMQKHVSRKFSKH